MLRDVAAEEIAVQRIVVRFLQHRPHQLTAPAFYRLAEQTACDTTVPRALDVFLQVFRYRRQNGGRFCGGGSSDDSLVIGRFYIGIIRADRMGAHSVADHFNRILNIAAVIIGDAMRDRFTQRFIARDVLAFHQALFVLGHDVSGKAEPGLILQHGKCLLGIERKYVVKQSANVGCCVLP